MVDVTETQANEAILEAWKAGWDPLHPADAPYTFENEVYTAVPQWVRVAIVTTARAQLTLGPIGTRRFQTKGQIAVQLFVDLNQGTKQRSILADDVRKVFEGTAIVVGAESIDLYDGATLAPSTDGRWLMATVVIPFIYFELR